MKKVKIQVTPEFTITLPMVNECLDLKLYLRAIEEQIVLRVIHFPNREAAKYLNISLSAYKRKLRQFKINKGKQ